MTGNPTNVSRTRGMVIHMSSTPTSFIATAGDTAVATATVFGHVMPGGLAAGTRKRV